MDEKLLNLLLDASQSKGEASKLTSDEASRFKTAFADPEFRKLFSEYADELADPKNREETEAYISQLEDEQKVPQGKELIRPSAGFVVKTKRIGNNSSDKVFINIVHSDKIEKPTKKLHKVDGKEGFVWSLPYSVGPPHMEKDKKGDNVPCFDCCFHPEALQLSSTHEKFRELVINTSIDGIDQLFKNQNQNAKLDRDFHIVKGVSYKSGLVPTLLVNKESKKNWKPSNNDDSSSSSPPHSDTTNPLPSPPKTAATKPKTAIKKGFLNSAKSPIYNDKIDTIRPKNIPEKSFLSDASPESTSAHDDLVSELLNSSPSSNPSPESNIATSELKEISTKSVLRSNVPVAPTFTYKQRENTSIGDFQGVRVESTSIRPSELVYEINLPLVTSPSKVALDVSTKRLILKYLEVYSLEIDLPYSVYDVKGKASYDKAKKVLKIVLPVIQATTELNVKTTSIIEEVEEKEKEEEKNSNEDLEVFTEKHKKIEKSSTLESKSHPNKEEILKLKEEILKQAESAKLALIEQEEKKKLEMENSNPTKISTPEQSSSSVSELPEEDEDLDFILAISFEGPKKNFYFSNGDFGLGYYKDYNVLNNKKEEMKEIEIKKTKNEQKQIDHQDNKESKQDLKHEKMFSLKFPTYEVNQTDQAIAILIQQASIDATTVEISVNKFGLKLKFSTKTNEKFGCVLSINKSCTILGWSENDIKYDVAENNMVIVVKKNENQIWKNKDNNSFLEVSPYIEEQLNDTEASSSLKESIPNSSSDFSAQLAISSLMLSSNYISELD